MYTTLYHHIRECSFIVGGGGNWSKFGGLQKLLEVYYGRGQGVYEKNCTCFRFVLVLVLQNILLKQFSMTMVGEMQFDHLAPLHG